VKRGQVAQVVERSPEKAGVGGSTPSLATTYKPVWHQLAPKLTKKRRPESARSQLLWKEKAASNSLKKSSNLIVANDGV
jgi:hypothetical protein